MTTPQTILLIATLDTKGQEAEYFRQRIVRQGKAAIVLDCGMSGQPVGAKADITREEVARAGGTSYGDLVTMKRGDAETAMARGMAEIVPRLYREGRWQGVLALGGSDGTILATAGMRRLPLGVPKLVVSAMACGNVRFGEYVGSRDITIMPSGADVMGINPITRKIYDNAVGAICGMVDQESAPPAAGGGLIAVTMFGQTTPCAMLGREELEKAGYQVVAFHPNGVGGGLMEELVEEGAFCAVWDLTTQELAEEIVSGRPLEGPERLGLGRGKKVPRLVVPGCMDFIWGSPDEAERFQGRRLYHFNRAVVLGKLSRAEMAAAAALLAHRVSALAAPVTVLLPLRGISKYDKEGDAFYDPALDALLFETLRRELRPGVKLREVDAQINDPPFAGACVSALLELLAAGEDGAEAAARIPRSHDPQT